VVFLFGLVCVPLALGLGLAVTLARAPLTPRRGLILSTLIALFAPLLALWLFVINGYRHWSWWPFSYASIAPHVLAGLVFLALLARGLAKVSGSIAAKSLVGALACGFWLVVWLLSTMLVACLMGDCPRPA
jgi:hypothetical protein